MRLWIAGDSLVITPGWAVLRALGQNDAVERVGDVDGRVATGLTAPTSSTGSATSTSR